LTFNGGQDAFVARVNAKGTALDYCGYVGAAWCVVEGNGIAVDAAGNAYITGRTTSNEQTFPVAVGPDLTYNGGDSDAFVAKVNPQGTGLVYCGYIGGSGGERGWGIAVDAAGDAYVMGTTSSTEQTFPVTVGPDLTYNGGISTPKWDAFVAKVALLDSLTASGTPRPGGTVTLNLAAIEVRLLPYQLGTSLGNGPIPIDTRQLDLSPDDLLFVTVGGLWPPIFSGYRGVISSTGQAQAAINIPNLTALIGTRLHTAFVTL
ncbi:MAG: hypothetical protein GY778_10555, partial [bacterium]|nr:hypothetical protein [bacterium]